MLRSALAAATAAAALLITAAPASAQSFSDSYQFLEAVRKGDGSKVMKLITDTNGSIVNTKERDSGEAALHIIAKNGDTVYLRYLLQKGANPNIQDRAGNTPMMIAVNANFVEGVLILIAYKGDVNVRNSSGETPLIRAVQLRNAEMVRELLKAGADPDRPDNIAGLSARDYAKADRRSPTIQKLLADAPRLGARTTTTAGPDL
ncbi:ankyrin repeat domain-containing protein [Sphingomonas sp. G-3-2-10]|uniref:ankyrin repeat domain-containing protein n=1 Tax=Sphingomonas sp. G-3-2-10 TaxID=2728838 RepID=UPI00146ACD60|nr:ankyrin repeat domain-containing protein [Sphingomonas sp. G-3-2-10]NML07358.1 ankyrin repeat domain-containing protein [Sphingomonas sp. G-3-2-10]